MTVCPYVGKGQKSRATKLPLDAEVIVLRIRKLVVQVKSGRARNGLQLCPVDCLRIRNSKGEPLAGTSWGLAVFIRHVIVNLRGTHVKQTRRDVTHLEKLGEVFDVRIVNAVGRPDAGFAGAPKHLAHQAAAEAGGIRDADSRRKVLVIIGSQPWRDARISRTQPAFRRSRIYGGLDVEVDRLDSAVARISIQLVTEEGAGFPP